MPRDLREVLPYKDEGQKIKDLEMVLHDIDMERLTRMEHYIVRMKALEAGVEKARKKSKNKFIKGKCEKLPFDSEFDNVVLIAVLHNLKKTSRKKCLSEIHRVLKDDGTVMFTTPTKDFLDCLYYGKSIWKPRPLNFWKPFLEEHSFEFDLFEPFMDKKLLKFWDTGFRPYFKELMELRKLLEYKGILPEFKQMYVEVLKNIPMGIKGIPVKARYRYADTIVKSIKAGQTAIQSIKTANSDLIKKGFTLKFADVKPLFELVRTEKRIAELDAERKDWKNNF